MSVPRDVESIMDIVRSVIAEHIHKPASEIGADAKLESNLAVDSMAMIEINVSLEERFGIAMPDMAAVHDVETVGDLARFIAARLETAR